MNFNVKASGLVFTVTFLFSPKSLNVSVVPFIAADASPAPIPALSNKSVASALFVADAVRCAVSSLELSFQPSEIEPFSVVLTPLVTHVGSNDALYSAPKVPAFFAVVKASEPLRIAAGLISSSTCQRE